MLESVPGSRRPVVLVHRLKLLKQPAHAGLATHLPGADRTLGQPAMNRPRCRVQLQGTFRQRTPLLQPSQLTEHVGMATMVFGTIRIQLTEPLIAVIGPVQIVGLVPGKCKITQDPFIRRGQMGGLRR